MNSGYLIISLKKSSREKFEKIFSNLSQSFQIIQELNIESYFRNKSLFLFKNRNVKLAFINLWSTYEIK